MARSSPPLSLSPFRPRPSQGYRLEYVLRRPTYMHPTHDSQALPSQISRPLPASCNPITVLLSLHLHRTHIALYHHKSPPPFSQSVRLRLLAADQHYAHIHPLPQQVLIEAHLHALSTSKRLAHPRPNISRIPLSNRVSRTVPLSTSTSYHATFSKAASRFR